jgi:uncharacterized protein YtpQ (UPF0354 family)
MRRGTLLALLLLCACQNKDSLAERVQRELLRAMPRAQVRIESPTVLKVKATPEGNEFTLGLDNLKLECAKGEELCRGAIENLVANAKVLAGPHDDMKLSDVRLTLKDAAWLAKAAELMNDLPPEKRAQSELLRDPFVGDLSIVYVLDLPRGIRMLQAGDLQKLGVDRAKLVAVARENLRKAFPDMPLERVGETDLWTNARGDDYDSACLVLTDLWKPQAEKWGGTLVLSVPSRNRLFATGSTKPAEIAALREATRRARSVEPHPLSDVLLKWTPKGWELLKGG